MRAGEFVTFCVAKLLLTDKPTSVIPANFVRVPISTWRFNIALCRDQWNVSLLANDDLLKREADEREDHVPNQGWLKVALSFSVAHAAGVTDQSGRNFSMPELGSPFAHLTWVVPVSLRACFSPVLSYPSSWRVEAPDRVGPIIRSFPIAGNRSWHFRVFTRRAPVIYGFTI